MTLKYGNKSVPFGAIVTHGENKNGSIVAENGQVYLTGLPQSGQLQVSWGKDKNSNNTASGLGIEILDANMRPVKLNDLHAGMQWIPLVPEQNNILPYSARLKSTQKSVNPGLVRASATFTLEFQ
ncbi:FimD/PapC C-terminal domain-containing protein [Escherichia coli]|uniref:FimD/PapC C-terminal domain-containing protein n=1 Tax=Escherichia coli TaxID=562 RepID=UPI00256EC5AE|nr:FimD/PapC C-terminal domain-containing protein [Escherichia coli]